jgi:hypothetical protein
MKYALFVLLAVISAGSLTACNATARDRDGSYISVGDDDRYHGGGYNHCPPGHAKKGWC